MVVLEDNTFILIRYDSNNKIIYKKYGFDVV